MTLPNSITSSSVPGSAGCVARQPAECGLQAHRVAAEAGPKDANLWIHVPIGYGKLFKEKSVNWMYADQSRSRGLNGRQVFSTPRGKVLGGSRFDSTACCMYAASTRITIAVRQRGNAGWGFDDVLPYFKKAENQSTARRRQISWRRRSIAGVGLAPRRSAVGSLCGR